MTQISNFYQNFWTKKRYTLEKVIGIKRKRRGFIIKKRFET